MKLNFCLTTALLVCALSISALAQNGAGNLARFTALVPKEGKQSDFEAGYKRHLAWHRANGDSWSWYGWFITSGTRRGTFIDATFGRTWTDFDKAVNPAADRADNERNVLPFADDTTQYTAAFLPSLSRQNNLDLDAPLQKVIYFKLYPGRESDFRLLISSFTSDLPKLVEQQSFMWFRIEDGGETPQYFVMLPHRNFAEFEQTENLLERMSARSSAVSEYFQRSVREMHTETMRFRSDLTYIPN